MATPFTYRATHDRRRIYAQRFVGTSLEVITAYLYDRGTPVWLASFETKDPRGIIKQYPHEITEAELPGELRIKISDLSNLSTDLPLSRRNSIAKGIWREREAAADKKR